MVSRETTRIIGLRLPTQIAAAFKKEAADRNMRLNLLFQEMWALYRRTKREEPTSKK